MENLIHDEQSNLSFALPYVIELCMQQPHSDNMIILDFIVTLVGEWKKGSTAECQLQDFSDYSLKYTLIICGLCMHIKVPQLLSRQYNK